jgi:hypothetical protein
VLWQHSCEARHRKAKRDREMAMAMAEVDHLAAERATARFDVEEMKVAWAGSRNAVHVADRMARLVASDPVSKPRPIPPHPFWISLPCLPHRRTSGSPSRLLLPASTCW